MSSSSSRTSKRRARTTRTTTTCLAAQKVAEIDDLLIQILTFLPIKALLRFKCVSKHWLSLITNPEFSLRIIISSNPQPISGLFLHRKIPPSTAVEYEFLSLEDDDDEIDKCPKALPFNSRLRFADHPTDMIILQSCNGLLLCKCSCLKHTDPNYYVYNPTTKQNTLLPPMTRPANRIHGLSLAFDPSKSPHYRVFCLRTSDDSSFPNLCQMEVYSSNSGPWRLSGHPFTLPLAVGFENTVYWNGKVHWFSNLGDCISYDIEQKEISILPLPQPSQEDEQETNVFRFLDECGGYLHFIEVHDMGSAQFCVYEMERDGSGWSPKYNVDLELLAKAFPEMIRTQYYTIREVYAFSVVCVVKEDINKDSYIVLHIPNKAVKYSFKDKTYKIICDLEPPSDDIRDPEFLGFHGSFKFIQSLAFV